MGSSAPNSGVVEAVRGSVVDIAFPEHLPAINRVLDAGGIVIEVAEHLDAHTVRGIALSPTRDLSRGSEVTDTQQPLKVPVGERVLGRVFDVFGRTIDGGAPMEGGDWRSIHAPPAPLMRRAASAEVFVTGIKAIDVLAP